MARKLTRSPKAPKTHSKKKSKRKSVYSIRFKLVFAILVPVVFIVLLGINSYQKASKALIENYEASTKNTVKITADYYDLIIGSLESIAYDTVLDATTKNYFTGVYDINPVDKWNTEASLIQNATSTVTGNEFLRSILIVPEQFGSVIYSDTKVDASFYKDIEASEYARALESTSYIWVGEHSQFDATLKTDTSKYSMSLIRVLYNTYFRKAGYAIFDVDYDNFKKKIADTNICEGAVIALITPDGRELSARMLKEGEMEDVTRPDDYVSNEPFIATLTEESGSDYVEYMGESYLMVYQKLASEGFTVVALVPEAVIVEDAQLIFRSTVNFVIISCIVAIIVGTIISESFLKAIRQMTKGLSKASEGDLTVRISTKSKDEFLTLSESINDMIDHVRHLLTKANSVNEVVDAASEEVSANADVMLNSTIEIKNSIAEIDAGIVGQAEDAEKCLHQMDALADQIEEVAKSAGNIADISNKTRGIVTNGLTTIDELKEKSNDTRAVTEQVIKSIEELNESSASIEEIIGVINSIAGRTSLLSLNATIEAARAGEYGRGFSVVADEIRKLAEQSMESVKNIQSIVGDIREQTQTTVEVARKSSEIVKSQDETLTRTVEVFTSIDEHVASLTGDLDSILDEIKTIEIAKKETLQAIESISAISEETAAVTSTVQDSAQSQLEAAETLANAAKALRTDSEDLSTAIHMFTV